MIINKEILIAHGTCPESLEEFINVLGNGDDNFQIDFDAGLNYIKGLDISSEEKVNWLVFVRNLRNSPDFYLLQQKGVFMEKYHVFNTLTGIYEEATSLSDAKMLRQRIIDEYIANNSNLFNISQEVYVPEEDKSLWKVVE